MKYKNNRESGIELLRILAAIGIVYGHYLNDGHINDVDEANFLFFDFLRVPVTCAVDIFLLIMGYFSCTSYKRSYGKPVNLLGQMSFYGVVIYLVLSCLGYRTWSLNYFISSAIPYSWFITLYLVVYFISPYINMVITKLSPREWKWFLGFILFFYSIWPMMLGIIEAFNRYIESWSTIGRNGDFAGYHIITFIMMYCVGGCIRLNRLDEKISTTHAILGLVVLIILDYGMRFIPLESTPWHIARWYSNIIVVAMAVYSFIIFKRIKYRSKYINAYASCAFTIYLIHSKLFVLVDTYSTLRLPISTALLKIGFFILFICVASFLLYVAYNFLVGRYVSNRLDKYEIPYFDK